MKIASILTFLLLFSSLLFGQDVAPQNPKKVAPNDTIVPGKGTREAQLKKIEKVKVKDLSDSTGNEPNKSPLVDTTKQNKYGDLLKDDPKYNRRYSFWKPAVDIIGFNALLNVFDRSALDLSYAKVDFRTWTRNLKAGWPWGSGWEWDQDRFGMNFFMHPYCGSIYYNAARSNGYDFYLSTVYAFGGSYMWKIFGENGVPERNDLITTTVSGALLGEILYRLSSNILDDRTRGTERVLREIAAGLIDPMRGFNRLLQGKTFRRTNTEVYQKEPVNISFYAGARWVNDENYGFLGNGTINAIINAQLDYGNPFELSSRKAYDFFKLRVDFNIGVGRKYLDNLTGYGILVGKNYQLGKLAILLGGFQYYDYWDTKTFEMGAIGLGGGVITKLPLSKTSNLYTKVHLAIVPFAGSTKRLGVFDTAQVRDYNFGGGLEGKFEGTVNLSKYATFSMIYYFFMVHTYVGTPGNNFLHILKPRITVALYKGLSIGFENYIYYNDRYETDYPNMHTVRMEQKIFLLLYLQDKQRRGYYN
jgi:hypothetical protein